MSGKEDIRSWAGLPSHKDRLSGRVYEPDRQGHGVEHLIRSVRPGSIVECIDLMWLSGVGRAHKRRRQLVTNMEAICKRGGTIRELSTGDEAAKHKARMLMRAYEMIGRAARGLKSAANGRLSRGRPRKSYEPDQLDLMERIWFSRRYKTRDEAINAIRAKGIKVKKGWLYNRFGSPDQKEPDEN